MIDMKKYGYRPVPPVAKDAPMVFSTPKWVKSEQPYFCTPHFDMGNNEKGDNVQVKYSTTGVLLPDGSQMFESCRFESLNRMVTTSGSQQTEWGILYPTMEKAQEACRTRHQEGYWPQAPQRFEMGLKPRDAKFTEEQVRKPYFSISAHKDTLFHVFCAARDYLKITRGDIYAPLEDGLGFKIDGDDLIVQERIWLGGFASLCEVLGGGKGYRTRDLRLPLWILWKGTDWMNLKMR